MGARKIKENKQTCFLKEKRISSNFGNIIGCGLLNYSTQVLES